MNTAATRQEACIDGNEAVARVAYRLSEVMAIYPITPASPMGEWADSWASQGRPNLWGSVPEVVEMQSEAGAAGVLHGALQVGALTTTFTSSQGLLLMLPNLYKIAGELTAAVIHVASRALATSALSIFGDHSDVMATRGTGWALLYSASVQETGDFAAIATAATLAARVPVLHGFDGFRTSHEIQRVSLVSDDTLQALVPWELVQAHRNRGLNPDHPVVRGTSQNPDVCFQAREAVNRFEDATPGHIQAAMDRFAALTGRSYQLFEYHGHPQADRVVVLMGSGCETACETVDRLQESGQAVGVLKVRLFRPLAMDRLVAALPAQVRAVAVLDRCKEPGCGGEPLYLDVVAAITEYWQGPKPLVVGGRFGLASKEFTPAMVRAVFANLAASAPQNHFTVGIDDDLTHRSLSVAPEPEPEPAHSFGAIVYGLGSDGTVSANKNSIKIIGEATGLFAQGYVVYDSKKAGSVTESHLRFSPRPIQSTYLIQQAQLIACHHWEFLEQFDLLDRAATGATLLLNSPWPLEQCWEQIPPRLQQQIEAKGLRVFAIEAGAIANAHGLGRRSNTLLQACFFALTNVMPLALAIDAIGEAIQRSYGTKGTQSLEHHRRALEAAVAALGEIRAKIPSDLALPRSNPAQGNLPEGAIPGPPRLDPASLPAELRELVLPQLLRRGDQLPVSALPADGSFSSGTSQWEKRNIADAIPIWNPLACVQCSQCVLVCPHAAIRAKVAEPAALSSAPAGFLSAPARDPAWRGLQFTLQVAPEDCTGCGLCVEICPSSGTRAKEPEHQALTMAPQRPLRDQGRAHWSFFLTLADADRRSLNPAHIRQQQLQRPLFEFSGACAGCGETPYLKLASQLFGDRMVVANATGCSSIYGGNLPTTPWATNADGRGPAWSNSLFEDNAEFGLGFRIGLDQRRARARELLGQVAHAWQAHGHGLPAELVRGLLDANQSDEAGIHDQRQRVAELQRLIQQRIDGGNEQRIEQGSQSRDLGKERELLGLCGDLVKRSVWIVGGDGWAYDIGFGGIDHLLAGSHDVNLLVLDTELYSNTGGQMSKSTPKGAVAKFASGGKRSTKKDLGLMAMTYRHVYVASVAMGARDEHTVRVLLEAESFPGPSLILAYAHCIAHGIDMAQGMAHQRMAVESGRWLLFRHDPRRRQQGRPALVVDSPKPSVPLAEAMEKENRFRQLHASNPEQARLLTEEAQRELQQRWELYQRLAAMA